jgi:hypothetical protein
MNSNSTFRRSSAAVGAAGILALTLAGPASARVDPGAGELPRCTSACFEGGTTETPITQVLRVDDNAVDFLQLGGGVLAGIALAGAGMAVASRRNHAHIAHTA